MSTGEAMYLAMAIAGVVIFAITLMYYSRRAG